MNYFLACICLVDSNVALFYVTETRCGHPAVPPNARATLSTKTIDIGTTAKYRCDEG